MTVTEFLTALALGAGAIALWINFRFPSLAPERIRTAVIHVGVAMVVGMAIVPAIDELVTGNVSPLVRAIVITFLVGLPALIYALLTSIWVILIAQGAMRRYR
jgi:hypothetical protein